MNSFPALFDRHGGTATISPQKVDFISHDLKKSLSIPLSSLTISLHGRNSVHYYLSDRENPSLEISLQSRSAIELLSLFKVESATEILKKSRQRFILKSFMWLSPFAFGVICLFLIPFFFSFLPVSWLNQAISVEQEQALGRLMWNYVKPNYDLLENSKPKDALTKLLNTLIEANPELKKFKFEIFIHRDEQVNAFALPGGKIVFNTGLLKTAEVSEIFGVLAHEVAHVERRHILKALSGTAGSLAGFVIIYSLMGADAASVVMQVQNLTSLSYSRQDESEADQRGLQFIQQAGFSGKGLASFFNKLAEKNSGLEKSLFFFSTHPASEERAEALEKQIASESVLSREFPVQLEDFNF